MPHSSHTQQKKTHEAAASYSPRLCNEDLAPTRDQNWSWYNIFSFWMSDVHSMGGYVVAASFFTLGLASWQVLLCLLVGICIVQLCANLVAKPSQMAGVPYAVICRQAFGVFGANIPAVIRGLIAFAWYGIQTYLAANALMLVLLKFWPSLASLTSSSFLGLSPLGWLCFATMWLLQAMVFWHGMNAIKRFIDIASGGLCGDAGAGRLDCIQDWSGRYLLYPRQQIPERRRADLADDHRHGAGGLLLLRAAA